MRRLTLKLVLGFSLIANSGKGDFVGKNRDRICLIASVVEAAHVSSTKTRIMFRANLSYQLLEKYLGTVINLGFI
jgi:predicted transcriptional regulator